MDGTTEAPAIAAGVDVSVDFAQTTTMDDISWNVDTGAWMGSEDVAGFKTTLAKMNSKLDMILGQRETSNKPFAKRVSYCPPLCSFFIIITHDVVLLFTSASTKKKHGVKSLEEKCQSARTL